MAYSSIAGSSFSVDKWHLFDWEFMLRTYSGVKDLAIEARDKGLDAREIFFALSGRKVAGSGPAADVWREMLDTQAWKSAITEASKGRNEMAASLMSLIRAALGKDSMGQQDAGDNGNPDGDDEEVMATLPAEAIPSEDEAEMAQTMAMLVGVLAGHIDRSNPQSTIDQVMNLATKLDIKTFSSMLGHIGRVVRGASRRTQGGTEEMTGYGPSAWTDKVVAPDMLGVADGDLGTMVRFAESQLTIREYNSHREMGKGPVILLRDESASMAYNAEGTESDMGRHKAALSFEVALANSFNRDGRDLITIAWGGSKLREHTWGDPSCSLKDHLFSFLDANTTRPVTALHRALDIANEYVPGADILIVTDGQVADTRSEQLDKRLESFRDDGGRVWAVVVGTQGDTSTWKKLLGWCTDAITGLDDLATGSENLDAVIAGMANRSTGGKREIS